MADTRTLARPAKRVPKRPTADMSPGKAEERIRDYPTPAHDHKEVMRKASGAAIGFGFDILFSLWGMTPAAKESKQE